MKDSLSKELISDLKYLYCKTGSKVIEDIFIIAAGGNEFISWIQNRPNLGGLENSGLYKTLYFLSNNYQNSDVGSLIRAVQNDPNGKEIITYIRVLYKFATLGSDARGYLHPFTDTITTITDHFRDERGFGTVDSNVEEGLTAIFDFFEDHLRGNRGMGWNLMNSSVLKKKRSIMFGGLFNYFENKIASVIEQQNPKLASDFRSSKALLHPELLKKCIHIPFPVTQEQVGEARKIARIVLDHTEEHDFQNNVETIRNGSMHFVGALSYKDVEEMEANGLDVTEDKWLHLGFLLMLSVVLFTLYDNVTSTAR